jgi:pyruvate/2-oxoglutarate/acetoin dehydrogenase E1 component/TPP-dependent pyruvate/acetoin dehydrogenase alpha subunit
MENVTAQHTAEYLLNYEGFRNEVLNDYRIAIESREASLLGRREVLTGKAKFGIFGDGKEIPQIAMAKFFKPGDFRSGYYRDQTFMFAAGLATYQQFFAQLYADPDVTHEPFSGGRQMSCHFSTPTVDAEGNWRDLAETRNVSADIAPTAGQMPRGLGLALASKAFRNVEVLKQFNNLSHNGNEVCFCTIGDASTSEGHFWETINAAGVLQVPLAVFVWDDGYGISVPKTYQTTKGSISSALKGFQKKDNSNGIDIYRVKGWDYAGMCEVFEQGIEKIRQTHTPAVFHVEEITQPQGHSTSGSHERYKTPERLGWEKDWDCIKKMKEWIMENGLASEEELEAVVKEAREKIRQARNDAWEQFSAPIKEEAERATAILRNLPLSPQQKAVNDAIAALSANDLLRRDITKTVGQVAGLFRNDPAARDLTRLYQELKAKGRALFNDKLYNEGQKSALKVQPVPAAYAGDAPALNGFEVLNRYFDALFETNPKVMAFGEDLGFIGDVNQGFSGLQEKYGEERIFDTGIRELTIIGQGIGLAMRGLRPIAEIQYLDYLLYGLQPLSDDAATLHYRTKGQQVCPLIVRTRGHRLEGIWHSGSPMGVMLGALRGMYICVPRNMVQAIGMYNTLLQANDPAIVVECLNGYRLKEKLPSNLLEFTLPLGVPEVVQEGTDITIVSYGSTLRIVQEAAAHAAAEGISCEVVDVRTLLPFDTGHLIRKSLEKTSRILFVDEDVPGGATAYMFNKVMEEQGGYKLLDVSPRTISAQPNRAAYGSDGDYFCKPNAEDILETLREIMAE